MATKLLEQTFIDHFRRIGFPFSEPGDNAVAVEMPFRLEGKPDSFTVKSVLIIDHKIKQPYLLTMAVPDVVPFTEIDEYRAYRLCNELNQRDVGRFSFSRENGILFSMQATLNDDPGTEVAFDLFRLFVKTLADVLPLIEQVRRAVSEAAVERILSEYESVDVSTLREEIDDMFEER